MTLAADFEALQTIRDALRMRDAELAELREQLRAVSAERDEAQKLAALNFREAEWKRKERDAAEKRVADHLAACGFVLSGRSWHEPDGPGHDLNSALSTVAYRATSQLAEARRARDGINRDRSFVTAERDAARKERDEQRDTNMLLVAGTATIVKERDTAIAERDALRKITGATCSAEATRTIEDATAERIAAWLEWSNPGWTRQWRAAILAGEWRKVKP